MHKAKARNYGIDVLRLISMFFIITLHTLYHGEIINTCKAGTINHAVSTLLITIVWCGVDIFAIISGFVGYGYEREKSVFTLFSSLDESCGIQRSYKSCVLFHKTRQC